MPRHPSVILVFKYFAGARVSIGFLPLLRPTLFLQRFVLRRTRPQFVDVSTGTSNCERRLRLPDSSVAASRVADRSFTLLYLFGLFSFLCTFFVALGNSFHIAEQRFFLLLRAFTTSNRLATVLVRICDLGPLLPLPLDLVAGIGSDVQKVDLETQDLSRLALLRIRETRDIFSCSRAFSLVRLIGLFSSSAFLFSCQNRWLLRLIGVVARFYAFGGDGFWSDFVLLVASWFWLEFLRFVLLFISVRQRYRFVH